MLPTDATGKATPDVPSKKRRHRACISCKRKKIRCNGDRPCAPCVANVDACSYAPVKTERRRPQSYLEKLEIRLEKTEGLIRSLLSDGGSGSEELFDKNSWMLQRDPIASAAPGPTGRYAISAHALDNPPRDPQSGDESPESSGDEEFNTRLATAGKEPWAGMDFVRFLGKSSNVHLVRTAWDSRMKNLDDSSSQDENDRPSQTHRAHQQAYWKMGMLSVRRSDYWQLCPWEKSLFLSSPPSEERTAVSFEFPEDDLLHNLVDLYFDCINIIYPVLHRPTVKQWLSEERHRHDHRFATNVMVICALGSRCSEDPCVLLDGTSWSAGWKWFSQVQERIMSVPTLARPALGDLQMYCLSTIFLMGSSNRSAVWQLVGIGIRLGQEVGANRKKAYGHKSTMEDELWKRAFWVLVVVDRLIAYSVGRSVAIQDEDFDLEYPECCDDEYWAHADPQKAFQQPSDKPSYISFFISNIKLIRILSVALRTIYSISKSKMVFGFVGPRWEAHVVSELNSALDTWTACVPEHLRWDPKQGSETFFHQSAMLHVTYYQMQILVHRAFISLARKPSPQAALSRTICMEAAHSCSRIFGTLALRKIIPMPQYGLIAFSVGMTLLQLVWGTRQSQGSEDLDLVLADIYKCIAVLRAQRTKWQFSIGLQELLCELLLLGNWELPEAEPLLQASLEEARAKMTGTTRASNRGRPGISLSDTTGQPSLPRARRDCSPLLNRSASGCPSDSQSPPGLPSPRLVVCASSTVEPQDAASTVLLADDTLLTSEITHTPESRATQAPTTSPETQEQSMTMWTGTMPGSLESTAWETYFNLMGARDGEDDIGRIYEHDRKSV